MTRPVRCGFAAILDPSRSIHTETVLRALEIYKDSIAGDAIEFICCDDYGSRDGGAHAADYLVSQGVDIVVGHYASNSALGAVQFYAEHSIPVLLPTATDLSLTRYGNHVFRLCANNHSIVRSLLELLRSDKDCSCDIHADESIYAKNLATLLRTALDEHLPPTQQIAEPSHLVFIGTGARSEMFLQDCERKGVRCGVVLSDDAACAHIAIPASLTAGQVRAVGFAPAELLNPTARCVREYVNRYGKMPGVFFMETIAALEIVHALQATAQGFVEELQTRSFHTSLGDLQFDRGEWHQAPLCFWSNDDAQQFRPTTLIRMS